MNQPSAPMEVGRSSSMPFLAEGPEHTPAISQRHRRPRQFEPCCFGLNVCVRRAWASGMDRTAYSDADRFIPIDAARTREESRIHGRLIAAMSALAL